FFDADEWMKHIQSESDAFFSSVHSFVKRRKPKDDLNRLVYSLNHKSQDKGLFMITDGAERLCAMLDQLLDLFSVQEKMLHQKLDEMKSGAAFLAAEYVKCIRGLREYR
ncbi:ATP-dependent helicase DinG, partial [Bacillus amyloliquefaciens]|nr:ATP-dependent helicase DinG [Bacillus amyloliquefaciens]